MRILCIAKFFGPGKKGGIEKVTADLIAGAADVGHQVHVVSIHEGGEPAASTSRVTVSSHRPLITLLSQPISLRYFGELLRVRGEVELAHLHLPNMLGALGALLLPSQVPIVVHWHSDVLGKGAIGFVFRVLEKRVLAKASVIIATSEAYCSSSNMLNRFRSKVKVIPIGIAEKNISAAAPNNAFLKNAIKDKKIILSVGRLVPYKGFCALVNAAKLLDNEAVVVIVGVGPQRAELEKLICASSLSTRVILAGALSDEELHYLYKHAYLFCMSSRDRAEAFGVVLIEAMLHGIPIVAPDIKGSGVPWVNQHRVTGINYPVGDAGRLASACNELLRDKSLRDEYAESARQRYLTYFTLERSVRSMLSVYNSLSADRG